MCNLYTVVVPYALIPCLFRFFSCIDSSEALVMSFRRHHFIDCPFALRYLDDVYLYGIHANALNKTGAIIPEEPMYLILNTAVSSTWGFPMPCPEGCACDCFDPRKEECGCALPSGLAETFPAYFLIDYVRVYQAVG